MLGDIMKRVIEFVLSYMHYIFTQNTYIIVQTKSPIKIEEGDTYMHTHIHKNIEVLNTV